MTDGNVSESKTPAEEVKPEAAEAPVTIKIAGGEEIVLSPNHLAVLVILDPTNGTPAVFNVQNCPLRAFSRMLLNEALGLYSLVSNANYTTSMLEQRILSSLKKQDKKGLINPFGSGK